MPSPAAPLRIDSLARELREATETLGLGSLPHTPLFGIARTVADLAGNAAVRLAHPAEAIQYVALRR